MNLNNDYTCNNFEYRIKKLIDETNFEMVKTLIQRNHLKFLSDEYKSMIRNHIKKYKNIESEPILMTNLGDVFIYVKEAHSIFLYYSRLNEMDLVMNLLEEEFDWFLITFLTDSGVLNDVLNKDFMNIPLRKNEILYCPPFLDEQEEKNYIVTEINLSFHFFKENY